MEFLICLGVPLPLQVLAYSEVTEFKCAPRTALLS